MILEAPLKSVVCKHTQSWLKSGCRTAPAGRIQVMSRPDQRQTCSLFPGWHQALAQPVHTRGSSRKLRWALFSLALPHHQEKFDQKSKFILVISLCFEVTSRKKEKKKALSEMQTVRFPGTCTLLMCVGLVRNKEMFLSCFGCH